MRSHSPDPGISAPLLGGPFVAQARRQRHLDGSARRPEREHPESRTRAGANLACCLTTRAQRRQRRHRVSLPDPIWCLGLAVLREHTLRDVTPSDPSVA
jgi:hypothetical protein